MGRGMTHEAGLDSAADATLTASRALLGIVARSVAPALDVVSLPHFRVLVLLSRSGPVRVSSLADVLGANLSTFSRSVDRLVAGGWVVRVDNPESRREVLLELTEDGRRLVRSVTLRRRRELVEILGRMDDPSRTATLDGMRAFAQAAGEPPVADLLVLGL